jgi:hypothetical protein
MSDRIDAMGRRDRSFGLERESNRRLIAIQLCAAALLVGIVMLAIAAVHSAVEQPSHGNSKARISGQQSDESIWSPSTWSPTTAFTALLAVFTAILAVGTIRLWTETARLAEGAELQGVDMKESASEAARAATAMAALAANSAQSVSITQQLAETQRDFWRRQMRAYITAIIGTAVYQEKNESLDLRFEGKPTVINTGLTPAHNVRQRIKSAILPTAFPKDFDWELTPGAVVAGSIIGAHQSQTINAIVDEIVPEEDVAAIKTGKTRALHVWGTVQYEDVFGETHFTNFCQVLTWFPDNRIMGYYNPKHNNAD